MTSSPPTSRGHARERARWRVRPRPLSPFGQRLLLAVLFGMAAGLLLFAWTRVTAGPPQLTAVDVGASPAANASPARQGDGDPHAAGGQQRFAAHLRRIGADHSPTAALDGIDTRINADIAVIDTGIDADHPDLIVAGGASCTGEARYDDSDGHGTNVAGVAAALDNGIGVTGVAPGARLWAVRVADQVDSVTDAQLICGLDWAAEHADTIDVVLISIGGYVDEVASSCEQGGRVGDLRQALCRAGDAGLVIVASAGNEYRSTDRYEPAVYDEVIAVSALSDSDGIPASKTGELECEPGEFDDHFASYSNFGKAIDLVAPGSCIPTTRRDGGYETVTGTSFAAPLAAGGAALYLHQHPHAGPGTVANALKTHAHHEVLADDPDGVAEPVLNLSNL